MGTPLGWCVVSLALCIHSELACEQGAVWSRCRDDSADTRAARLRHVQHHQASRGQAGEMIRELRQSLQRIKHLDQRRSEFTAFLVSAVTGNKIVHFRCVRSVMV